MSRPYPELRVEIRKSGNKYFAVTKQANGQEVCTNEFQHDPTGMTHLGPLWLLERGALSPDDMAKPGAALVGRASEGQVITYGQRLYGYLFGKGKQLQTFLKAEPEYTPLHLVLSLHPEVASLWRLPWEYLHDGEVFMCLNGQLRLSRLPEGLPRVSFSATPPPLRVLLVIAAPEDQKALDVERELLVVQEALESPRRAGRLILDVLDEATLPALQDALKRQAPYHILHYIGHGTYAHKQRRGFLCFEKRGGETELVGAEHLRAVLEEERQPSLIVITACQSAQIGVLNAFDNVATELLQFGIPAVLTVPISLSDDSAIALLDTFYGRLAEGQSPLDSLYQVRSALKEIDEERRRFDWGVPALCLRAQDTPLIDPTLEALPLPPPKWLRSIAGLTLPHCFVNRRKELRTLHRAQQDGVPVLALWGDNGSGKSTLAAEYIAHSDLRAEDVLVINCRELLDPLMALEKIAEFWRAHPAEAYGKAAALLLNARHEPAERARAAASLVGGYPHLMVFDELEAWYATSEAPNDDAPATIENKIMQAILQGLLTTRGRAVYLFIAQRPWVGVTTLPITQKQEIEVSALTPRHAVLLMNALPHLGRESLATQLDVYRILGGQPETLKLLEGWLATGHNLQTLRAPSSPMPQTTEAWHAYLLDGILDSLDPGESVAFTTLAICEGSFNVELMSKLTSIAEKYATPLLERWEKLALLQFHHVTNGVAWYNFHPIVHHHVLQRMSEETWTMLHTRLASVYAAPFVDEARRRLIARNVSTWPDERVEWFARDSHGILGTWVQQTQNVEYARRVMANAVAWQHHLFKAGKYEAAAHIIRTIVPILNRWGQHDLAETLLRRTLAVSSGAERVPNMDNLATLYMDRGHLDGALTVYEEAYRMFEAQGATEQMAHMLRRIARIYEQLGDTSQASQKYEAALQLMRKIGNQNGESLCLYHLSMLSRQMGDYKHALVCSQAAKELYEKAGNRAGVAAALYEHAINLKQLGYLTQALEYLQRSLEVVREIGDEALAVDVLHEMSILHRDKGGLDLAIEAAHQAVELCRRIDPAKAIFFLEFLGKLYTQRGDMDSAKASYAEARRLTQA